MITRADKDKMISALDERFGRAKAAFLVDYKGITVEQATKVRKGFTALNAEVKVVRNTLAKKALEKHESWKSALEESLSGTNAIIFSFGDVSASAKALLNYVDEIEHLQLKKGVMEGKAMDPAAIKYLATLPSKDVLRAQLLGMFAAPMSKFVRTLSAVPSGFVRVLNAEKQKKEGN